LSSTSANRHVGAREELAEEAPRERGDVGAELRGEGRQLAPIAELARSVPEVVEEARYVRIIRVDLVPEDLVAARFEVTRR
jgi:hypothetical protein